jgi:hypothetical protein
LMHTVRLYTFLDDSNVRRDKQLDLLKQAFTALSFGARLTTKGWQDTGGTWQNPALVSILKNPEERARFVKDPSVLAFIQEQNKLDDWLIEEVKKDRPELLRNPNLQTLSGRPSKAKIVAYLYQNNETHAMDVVRKAVEASGREVLANIHDAVVINKRLGAELKAEIEILLQEKTGNPYWRLGATQYERFNSTPKEVLDEEQLHKQRMAQLEAKAQGYEPKFATVDDKAV